jgi:hypothetical protein
MPSVILTSQPSSTLSVVPNQNTSFTVAASADFAASYVYQWKRGASNISGATSSTYAFEPALADNSLVYTCSVSAMSATSTGTFAQATVVSTGTTLTVTADSSVYSKWVLGAVAAVNPSKESGKERFLRMRHLGY